MKLAPQSDGRIAIVYTAAEDQALEKLGLELGMSSCEVAKRVYDQLMRPDAPDLVAALGRMPRVPLRHI